MPGWLPSGDGAVSQSPSKLSSVLPEATGACLTQTSCCQRHPQSQPEPALGPLKTPGVAHATGGPRNLPKDTGACLHPTIGEPPKQPPHCPSTPEPA